MVDSIYRTRSLGVAAEGLPDQYADGKAAQVWEYYIGHKQARTHAYRAWLTSTLNNNHAYTVLDVACGTGVDSIMLLEEGFTVTSTDASDKMLKYALEERWNRRKEEEFDKWVIKEANWLNLVDDLEEADIDLPTGGFDAVICLGNSFAHLPDFEGNLEKQKLALENFKDMIKPGGILLIDHRNYDEILATGRVPAKNIYYNSDNIVDIKCSNLYVNAKPSLVTLDYIMDMSILNRNQAKDRSKIKKNESTTENSTHHFRLSYYPHQLQEFTTLITEIFGPNCTHNIYGDFQPLQAIQNPAYYIHVVQKAL